MNIKFTFVHLRERYYLLLALPLVLAVVFAFIVPYGASFWSAFKGREEITLWENSAILRVTAFTAKQAFFSVLVSLAIGLPGAWIIGTGKSRFTPLLRALSAIPFAMPSILVVLGFVLFYGNSGWLNRLIVAFGDSFGMGTRINPLRILYKPEAIILAHGFLNFPLVIRLAGDGLERARRAYSSAAGSLGASPFVTALTVILPLSLPALMSAVLLVFLYCYTSFAVVLVLGGGPASTTLPVEIYRHARVFLNYGNAGALALVETLIAVSVFMTYVFFWKRSGWIQTGTEERVFEEKQRLLFPRILIAVYLFFAAVFVFGPILSIVLESLLYRSSRSAQQVLSLRWWQALGGSCLPAFFRSLVLAFFSSTLACALAVSGAMSVKLMEEKGDSGWAGLVRFFAASPLVSSGIVLGLGWLIAYRALETSPFSLVMLHAVIALPFAFNSVSEGFRSMPSNTLNAAQVCGAGPAKSILTTALPLSLSRIRSAWGFAASLSLGELNAVIMLGLDKWETLPLYIYRAAGAYRYGSACAAGTLLILACAAGLLLSETGRKNGS